MFVDLPGNGWNWSTVASTQCPIRNGFDVRCLVIPKQDMTNWDVLTQNVLNLIHGELAKGYQQVVYLCGESFGGCLAMKLAILAPHLFKYIILINPASSFHLSPWFSWISQLPMCFRLFLSSWSFGAITLSRYFTPNFSQCPL